MRKIQFAALLVTCTVTALASADGGPTTKPVDTYPLTKCVISDEALPTDGSAKIEMIDGREVRFCCADCVKEFMKDSKAGHELMDKKIVEATKATYPLKECLVSGEKLGEMGEPVMYVYRPTNQLVELCCKSCIKPFEKDPKPFLAKLDEASKAKAH